MLLRDNSRRGEFKHIGMDNMLKYLGYCALDVGLGAYQRHEVRVAQQLVDGPPALVRVALRGGTLAHQVLRELSAAVALHLALRVGDQDAHHRLPAVLGREVERRLGRVHLRPVEIVVEQLDGQHGRVRDGAPSARVHLGDRAGRDHREDELADLVRTVPGGNVQRVQPLGSEPARMGRAVDQQPGRLADQAAHLSQVAHPNRLDEPLLQRRRRRNVRDDWLGRVARQPAASCVGGGERKQKAFWSISGSKNINQQVLLHFPCFGNRAGWLQLSKQVNRGTSKQWVTSHILESHD